jgi:hypothetical protein
LLSVVGSSQIETVGEAGTIRVVIVPGLAVRSYAGDAARELRARGYAVTLLPAPAWKGVPKLLKSYGSQLAGRLDRAGKPVDLLIGLSVGSQAAAITAMQSGTVRPLVLVSPMVDPADRTLIRLLFAWLFRKQEGDRSFGDQVPDWKQAGIPRILDGFRSALGVNLEDVLPAFDGRLTIVQPEWNTLSSPAYAERLARGNGGRFILMPRAAHSHDLESVIRANGAEPRMIALRVNKSPRDIGAIGRYNSVLAREPSANLPCRPLRIGRAISGLGSIVAKVNEGGVTHGLPYHPPVQYGLEMRGAA